MNSESPELVFALIGPMGTNLDLVATSLVEELNGVGYTPVVVKLSDLLREISPTIPTRTSPGYYEAAIKAGNDFRQNLARADAVAALAMASIRRRREKDETATDKSKKKAYILSSLKRREEIDLLRDIYGASLFIVSSYAPRSSRVDRLATMLAEQNHRNQIADTRAQAEKLIRVDEGESDDYGQDVRKTYPLADLFVNTAKSSNCSAEVKRFIELIFGHPWHTPRQDEQHMAFAYLASLRSGSPSRQVGAALAGPNGNLLGVGTNEVPCPGGGQYWEGTAGADGRDEHYAPADTSDKMRKNLLSDVLYRIQSLDLLKDDVNLQCVLDSTSESYEELRKAQLFDTIDFVRAVHAEASALLSALGQTQGSTLFVTTFPCHECARHIVMAGVKRVVYVEPYPKSLVAELFNDSIGVDTDLCDARVQFQAFTGISPNLYQHLFSLTRKKRKENDGTLVKWNASQAVPRLHISYSQPATTQAEHEVLKIFLTQLKAKGIDYDGISGTT